MQITTIHVFPPIPDRRCDWSAKYAHHDPDQGPTGWGRTEQEAVEDLIENYELEENAQ